MLYDMGTYYNKKINLELHFVYIFIYVSELSIFKNLFIIHFFCTIYLLQYVMIALTLELGLISESGTCWSISRRLCLMSRSEAAIFIMTRWNDLDFYQTTLHSPHLFISFSLLISIRLFPHYYTVNTFVRCVPHCISFCFPSSPYPHLHPTFTP